MAQLTADKPRAYEVHGDDRYGEVPLATGTVYEGSAVGSNSGNARQLTAGDDFLGFCVKQAVYAAGVVERVKVKQRGAVIVDVTGVTGVGDIKKTVYASDGNVFTLASTSNSAIGKVLRHISSTKCVVYFEAAPIASV